MAMGKTGDEQEELFFSYAQFRKSVGHPFYELINRILSGSDFDNFVESRCERF